MTVQAPAYRLHKREWHSWCTMNSSCHNEIHGGFARYGKRGVIVCAEWRQGGRNTGAFERFLLHIGPKPEGTTLSLKDPNGNFEPGNVHWAQVNRPQIRRRRVLAVSASSPIESGICFRGIPIVFIDDGRAVMIPLTRGQHSAVDVEDVQIVRDHLWQAHWNEPTRSFYAQAGGVGAPKMHRLILGVSDPAVFIDHRNHDTLCNRRFNLRPVTQSQNNKNRSLSTGGSSQFKGVKRSRRRWNASIRVDGVTKNLGLFDTELAAALAYDAAARKFHGTHAFTNEDAGLIPPSLSVA